MKIKLKVGEDYIDELFYNIHIKEFKSEIGHYISKGKSIYLSDGTRIFWDSLLKKYELAGNDIIKHIPKASKNPSDEDIYRAFKEYQKQSNIDNEVEAEKAEEAWIVGIEWYKKQIR